MCSLKKFCHFLLCTTQNLHPHLQWIMEFDGRTISRMSYENELKILECKGTQYDRFGFWRLEDLKISSSFCAFVPSAYYVHWSDFGWFWMQMWCTLENQCVYTPIQYTKFQVPMHLQFCVSNITWKNAVTLLFCSSTIVIGLNKVQFGQCEGLQH